MKELFLIANLACTDFEPSMLNTVADYLNSNAVEPIRWEYSYRMLDEEIHRFCAHRPHETIGWVVNLINKVNLKMGAEIKYAPGGMYFPYEV